MRADRRLYLDRSQTRLVAESSPEAAFLLNAVGQEIDPAEVKRLGLVEVDGRVEQASQIEAKPAPEPEPAPEPDPMEYGPTSSADGWVMPKAPEAPSPEPPAPIMPTQSRRSRRKY